MSYRALLIIDDDERQWAVAIQDARRNVVDTIDLSAKSFRSPARTDVAKALEGRGWKLTEERAEYGARGVWSVDRVA